MAGLRYSIEGYFDYSFEPTPSDTVDFVDDSNNNIDAAYANAGVIVYDAADGDTIRLVYLNDETQDFVLDSGINKFLGAFKRVDNTGTSLTGSASVVALVNTNAK